MDKPNAAARQCIFHLRAAAQHTATPPQTFAGWVRLTQISGHSAGALLLLIEFGVEPVTGHCIHAIVRVSGISTYE